MKSRKIKISLFLMIFISTIIINITNVFAKNTYNSLEVAKKPTTVDEIIDKANNFVNVEPTDTIKTADLQKTINLIYNVLLAIGMVVAVIYGVILGIQLMTASAEGKANIKEKFLPYGIGCVIIFGAFGIWKLVMKILGGI